MNAHSIRTGFGNWFRRCCRGVGLPHCSAHGLREAGATIAIENGATEHQLVAIYGWESAKQAALCRGEQAGNSRGGCG
jgi:integrase